ncbi:hypothetical protein [Lentzea xinjiangensis]|uniref:hypothetical protein n=1 Tax=Lentzea xinjiangensis TaxID=402600 RepID=UPI001160A15E|nr:hypothetical protein [Lentzea xinjiangensis]
MADMESSDLEKRSELLRDLASYDIAQSTQALLDLTFDDPDRLWLEDLLLRTLDDDSVDPQLHSIAVTCMGHLGLRRGQISGRIVTRLRGLLADPDLGGIAEDALGDIQDHAVMVQRQ